MLKVVIRESLQETGKEIGTFPPDQVEYLVDMVRKYGAHVTDENDTYDAVFWGATMDVDNKCFEIIVER